VDLDLEVVGPGPVRVPRGGALVDPPREIAHLRDAVGDLVPEEHPAAARLRALADDDLDRVRAAQVVRVHAVARRQELIDEGLRVLPLLLGHAAVAGRRGGADLGRTAAERLFRRRGQRAEAHPRDRHGDLQLEWALRKACPEDDVGRAALAVALERVARDRRAEEEQVVEVRQAPLRPEAADVVDPLGRGALDLRDRRTVEEVRLAEVPGPRLDRHQYALSTWKL
jgi:hypothetical protein